MSGGSSTIRSSAPAISSVGVGLDHRVAAYLEEADLVGVRERALADELERRVGGRLIVGGDAGEVDPVALLRVEIGDHVGITGILSNGSL